MNARKRGSSRGYLTLLAAACLCLLPRCQFNQAPDQEQKFVTVRLNDSLSRYPKVQVLILADGDTGSVVGKVWDGKLDAPGDLPSYRLDDAENRNLTIRVKGFDADGALILDMRISKVDGRQVVAVVSTTVPDTSKPDPAKTSPALASLRMSPGTLAPAFAPEVKEYAANLAYGQSAFTVTLQPEYPNAAMRIGNTALTADEASGPIRAEVGENVYLITVIAADTSTQYVLRVTRAKPADTVSNPDTIPGLDQVFTIDWKHMAAINLNFAQMNIPDDMVVTDFPLLVRLTKDNFKLVDAGDGGKDLRFSNSAGKELAYEISRWDMPKGEAEIWIKLDTLRTDGSNGPLVMYWGNDKASAASSPAKVFPKEAGWSGVWHLDEEGKGSSGEYKDAVGRFNATGGGPGGAPARRDGMVGYCQDFKVTNDQAIIAFPDAFDPGDKAWTLSVWVKRTGTEQSILFNKAVGTDSNTQRFQIHDIEGNGQRVTLQRTGSKYLTDVYLPQDGFVLLGIVYTGSEAVFYVDGFEREKANWTQGTAPLTKALLGASDSKGNYGYPGLMDEFWTSSMVRSAAFMRLMYENQKPFSKFATLFPLK